MNLNPNVKENTNRRNRSKIYSSLLKTLSKLFYQMKHSCTRSVRTNNLPTVNRYHKAKLPQHLGGKGTMKKLISQRLVYLRKIYRVKSHFSLHQRRWNIKEKLLPKDPDNFDRRTSIPQKMSIFQQ